MIKQLKKQYFQSPDLELDFFQRQKPYQKKCLMFLDRPILEWAVIEASKSGIEEMIFVTSSKKNSIIEYFDKSSILEDLLKKKKKKIKSLLIQSQNKLGNFTYVVQDEPKGLGTCSVVCEEVY